MNIKKNITIDLSEDELKYIVADYLKRNGYEVATKDVKFSVGSRCEGIGPMEHEVTYFKGCFVRCKEK